MKILRGLTFKIFMILLISFLFVFGVVVYDKYNNYYYDLINGYDNKETDMSYYTSYLSQQFNMIQKSSHPENYSLEALKKDLRNAPKSMNSMICLLDNDFHLIEKTGFQKNDDYLYVTMLSTVQTYHSDLPSVDHYYLDISSLSQNQISLLEKAIESGGENVYFDGKIQEINNFQFSSVNTQGIQEKYYIVYPTYLHYNYDILGSMVQDYAKKGFFLGYIKQGELKKYDDRSSTYSRFVSPLSYQTINDLIEQTLDHHFSQIYIHSLACRVKSKTSYYMGSPVVNKDLQLNINDQNQIQKLMEDKESFSATLKKINEDDSYMMNIQSLYSSNNNDCLAGYLVCFYNFSDKGSHSVLQTLYEDYKITMFGSMIFIILFSYLISYMMTRRIKSIDQVAMQIADNHFDVRLPTHGHDELSSLSFHINTMSLNLKKNINQLQLEIDHVKKMENIRKEFIAQFTHEIKTPLAIMNGHIDLLEETDDPIKKKQYISVINKEIIKINDLVLEMLELSKLEAKAIILQKQKINLTELCEDIIDEYEQLFQDKNLHVDLQADDIFIEADLKRISMVIQNYLSNAIKHALLYSTISVSIEKKRFSIENEGEHLRDDMKEKIWQSFVSDDHQGTGLGLAICRHILELHGMNYGFENTKKGVLFYFDWSEVHE